MQKRSKKMLRFVSSYAMNTCDLIFIIKILVNRVRGFIYSTSQYNIGIISQVNSLSEKIHEFKKESSVLINIPSMINPLFTIFYDHYEF